MLGEVADRYPVLRDRLFATSGEIQRFVNVYVDDVDIRSIERYQTVVGEGSTVTILSAVSGC